MSKILATLAIMLLLAMIFLSGCASTTDLVDSDTPGQIPEYNGHFVIGGSRAGTPAIKILTDAFSKKHPGVTFEYRPGSKTSSALKQVANETLDIGIFARDLKPEEKQPGLNAYVLLYDAIAVIVNKNVPIESLTVQQVRDIYAGKIRNWNKIAKASSPIIICDRSEDETAKLAMRKFVFGDDLAITENTVILETESDMINAVSSTPYSIGYCSAPLARKDSNVKVLKIDGIEPSIANMRNGSYQVMRPVSIGALDQNETIKPFINFAYSKEARELLVKNGYLPAKDKK